MVWPICKRDWRRVLSHEDLVLHPYKTRQHNEVTGALARVIEHDASTMYCMLYSKQDRQEDTSFQPAWLTRCSTPH